MARVRLALGAALMLAVVFFLGIGFIPLEEEWVSWAAQAAKVFISLFAVAVAFLLASTLFKASDDLWDTVYFRYMRAFWGDYYWGGNEKPLRISVCRATWLSFWTFIFWISMISIFAFGIFLVAGFLANGPYYIEFDDDPSIYSQLAFLLVVELLALMFGFLFVWLNLLRDSINEAFKINIRPFILWSVLILTSLELVAVLIIMPIQILGIVQLVYGLSVGLAWLITAVAAIGVIAGFFLLIVRMSKSLSGTVPAVLTREQIRGWKEGICPLIIQKVQK